MDVLNESTPEPLPAPVARPRELRRWVLAGVWVAYAVLLAWVVRHHEPWADEAQAWLVARDLPIGYLVTRFIRYEGTPALWHLILAVPAKLHVSYAVLNPLAATIAAAGVALFLWKSRIPSVLKALLPFGFFLLFQYAAVARSYVLLLPALVLLALAARDRGRRPLRFTGAALLLANVSVHGAAIAGALMTLEAWGLARRWKALDRAARSRRLVALGVFGVGSVLLVLQLIPPGDLNFPAGRIPLANAPAICVGYLREAFCGSAIATLLVLAISVVWFARTGVLAEFLLPTMALLVLFSRVYVNLWHAGTLFLVWVYALWRSFDEVGARPAAASWTRGRVGALLTVVWGILLAVHVHWAWGTVSADLRQPYSGSGAVAAYLEATGLARRPLRAVDFASTGILPYFDHNIFENRDNAHGSSFWFWSSKQQIDLRPTPSPDAVIVGVKFTPTALLPWNDADFAPAFPPEYVMTRYFDGALFWKWGMRERDGFAVAVRKDRIPPQDLSLPRVLYQLGMNAVAGGHPEEGRRQLEAALRTSAPVPRVRFALAYVLLEAGQEALAAEQLRAPECQGQAARVALVEVANRLARVDARARDKLAALVARSAGSSPASAAP